VPLAVLSLGLVINGVYGAGVRDYVFIGALVLVSAYVTLTFPGWAARREQHRQARDAAYAGARQALMETLTHDVGKRVTDLRAAEARAEARLKRLTTDEAPARSRLKFAKDPVPALSHEYEELLKRLVALPVRRDWQQPDLLPGLQQETEGFRDRVEQSLTHLRAELAGVQAASPSPEATEDGATHCAACGQSVPKAPYCSRCGSTQPVVAVCPECGDRVVVPIHFFPEGVPPARELCCTRCGAILTEMVRTQSPSNGRSGTA